MARRRSTEEIEQVVGAVPGERSHADRVLPANRNGPQHTGALPAAGGVEPEQLIRVNLESAVAEATAGFALVLGNGRRIESGWRFGEAELARLIRVAEGA